MSIAKGILCIIIIIIVPEKVMMRTTQSGEK